VTTVETKKVASRCLAGVARVSGAVEWRAQAYADRLNGKPAPLTFPANATFRDRHAGKRAFVIGNGPSLASQDLRPLEGELLFTVNAFDRHPLCDVLQPPYHFFADPEMNDGSQKQEDEIVRVGSAMPHSTFFIPAWPSLVSRTFRDWYDEGRLHLVPMTGDLSAGPVTTFDMVTGLPGVQTVVQLAFMVAVFMGCSPIYLTGVDSDWAASTDLDRHFYEERTLDESWDWHYERILESTLTMFRGYRFLWDYCRTRQVEVYNVTGGGLLDVFPCKRFEDVVDDKAS
jgi:hypothetical protein